MPGVAALGAVVAGLVALVLLYALAPLLRPLLVAALSQIPVAGGWIAANTDFLIIRAEVWAARSADAALQPIVDTVQAVRIWLVGVPNANVDAQHDTVGAIWRVRYQALPAAIASTQDYVEHRIGDVVALAYNLHGAALGYATEVGRDANAYTTRVRDAAAALAYALHGAALGYATQLYQAGLAFATQVQLAVSGLAYALHGQALDYARTLHSDAISYTQSAVADAEGFAERVGVDAEGYARALERAAIDHADAVGATAIAYAALAAGAVAIDLAELKGRDCIRFCDALGGLGSSLQELIDLGVAAALVALAAAVIHDPQAASSEFRGVFEPLFTAAGAAARSELGV